MALTVPAGAHLGRYEIVKHLASGLMAELLLARARGLEGFERHFVIKRIRAEQERDDAFIEMFLAEARLAAALHHHNIVQVHDIGEDDGKPYFAMEYVHGEDLRCVLGRLFERGEHMPLEHVIAIVSAVAGALHHAHEAVGPDRQPLGIVHRDVTPANILLGYDGNVKVVDFGIARAAMRRTETQAGMLVGKAPYMAPEQCVGGTIDRRSDVFALGIVLFELLAGRRLFKGDNEFLTMSAVVEAKVPPPSAHRSDVTPALDRIVLKALSRDPAQRYQTAEQMFFALDQLASAEGLRSSGLALAAFMKELFGHRVEPWLGNDDRARSTSPDFDGPYPGLAAPPTGALESYAETPSTKKASPITRARNHAISVQPATKPVTAAPVVVPEPRSTAVRIPDGPVPARAVRDKAAFRTTQVPVAPMPTRQRPKTKTVQIPVTKSPEATIEALEATRVDADLAIPVEPAPPPRAVPAPTKVAVPPKVDTTPLKVASTSAPRTDATPPPRVVSTSAPRTDATPPPRVVSTSIPRADATPPKVVSTTPPRADATPPPKASPPRTQTVPAFTAITVTPAPPRAPTPAPGVRASSEPSPRSGSTSGATSGSPSGMSITAFSQKAPIPSVGSSSVEARKPPPPLPVVTAEGTGTRKTPLSTPVVTADAARKTPPPLPVVAPVEHVEAPKTLAASSQAMAPVAAKPMTPALDDVDVDWETEIDPLRARQGEVAAKSSVWTAELPDEPSVVVRSKSLVMAALTEAARDNDPRAAAEAALAAAAAKTDEEDARADAEEARIAAEKLRVTAERARPDSEAEPPTRVDNLRPTARAESHGFTAEETEIDDAPTRVPATVGGARGLVGAVPEPLEDDGSIPHAIDDSMPIAVDASDDSTDGPTRVMPDLGDVPPVPAPLPLGEVPAPWPQPQLLGPPERGSQDRITPLPPPPMMPEITDYPRLAGERGSTVSTATATTVQGWKPSSTMDVASPVPQRKKLVIAAAVGAVLLAVILAFALRGGDKAPPPAPVATPETKPRVTEPVPEPPPETGSAASASPVETGRGSAIEPTPKTTPRPVMRPTKKPVKAVAAKPVPKKPAVKPPVKKPPVKKPPEKKPGWDPNSLFPKKK